jgi:hypothetical protein
MVQTGSDRIQRLLERLFGRASWSFLTKQHPLSVRQSARGYVECRCYHADHETDAHIQESLRTQLGSDVTVLIVAHRLRTIADADKIVSCAYPGRKTALTVYSQLVLDAGRLV